MNRNTLTKSCLIAFLLIPLTSWAQMIGVTGGSGGSPGLPGAVVQIDPTDGSSVTLGTPFDGVGLAGVALAPDGTVYVVSSQSLDGTSHLLVIDPTNGNLVSDLGMLLDASGNGCAINEIEFHPSTGLLYAMASNNSSIGTRCGVGGSTGGYLLTIDIDLMEYTVLGREPTLGNNSGGIAFNSDGALYFTPGWNTVGTLHTLNLADGSFTSTVNLSESLGFHGLSIDPGTGTMYGSLPMSSSCCSQDNPNIYTIDPSDGTLAVIGSPGDFSVHDTAFVGPVAPTMPPVPVPTSGFWAGLILTMFLALLTFMELRRRQHARL